MQRRSQLLSLLVQHFQFVSLEYLAANEYNFARLSRKIVRVPGVSRKLGLSRSESVSFSSSPFFYAADDLRWYAFY
jgi:hypothetical protein